MKLASRGVAAVLASVFAIAAVAVANTLDGPEPPAGMTSLREVPVPKPTPDNLAQFIANEEAALQLGKALFWDIQVGSDGMTACATCHFHAGADSRSKNQLNPGKDGKWHFGFGPNYHLQRDDFPLRNLHYPADRASTADDNNDVVSSQGVFNMEFQRNIEGLPFEIVKRPFDPVFSVGGLNVRRVEPRNTPTVINAVFNYRNFWDGRAQNEFNGVDNWGDRNPKALVYRASSSNAPLVPIKLSDPMNPQYRLINSSLASQAVAPILSADEMSAAGRDAADIGSKIIKSRAKKLALTRPLVFQQVHPDDSVLGGLSRWPYPGLTVSDYETLIRKAFRKEWWDSKHALRVNDDGTTTVLLNKKPSRDNEYTLTEYNFSLFFGLALQLYQATLVSDDTAFDKWLRKEGTISWEAFRGFEIFNSQDIKDASGAFISRGARCSNCHSGIEFTDASVSSITKAENASGSVGSVRRKRDGQELDRGFNNIGVRFTEEDLGVGGADRFGNALSAVSLCRLDPTKQQRNCPTFPAPTPEPGFALSGAAGAFKAPGLRNVELTAPYFHNGGHRTLESVIKFYSRGGDLAPIRTADGTQLISPLSIPALDGVNAGFSDAERDQLLAFLNALTDERVRYHRAPFDHPQLFVPDGQLNDNLTTVRDPFRPGQAMDRVRVIPAVGAAGYPPEQRPLNFLEGQP